MSDHITSTTSSGGCMPQRSHIPVLSCKCCFSEFRIVLAWGWAKAVLKTDRQSQWHRPLSGWKEQGSDWNQHTKKEIWKKTLISYSPVMCLMLFFITLHVEKWSLNSLFFSEEEFSLKSEFPSPLNILSKAAEKNYFFSTRQMSLFLQQLPSCREDL